MTVREYKTELGALKAALEWRVSVPRRVWTVEGYNIIRLRSEYRTRYQIDQIGARGTVAENIATLTDAFRWVAEHRS